jgi:predicted 3-demethylubiquinone-9 3-methyltransferase (glyoxalase superfamily)
MNNKITTNLWFDNQAEEAAEFYTSVFGGTTGKVVHYPDTGQEITGGTPGSVMTVEFEIADQGFVGLNGGPIFQFNPSISFMVNYDPSRDENAKEMLNEAWNKLTEGGKVLMPLDSYPFSEHYGWVQDKFGASWQLILTDPTGEPRPFIIPSLLFVGDKVGKAEEAMRFYLSVFKDAKEGMVARYPARSEPDKEGTIMFADFMLENQWFAVMDSAQEHGFTFNEALSFIVNCDTQEEIDSYWEKLSAVPEAEQCGWLKDKYGVSWQITPAVLNKMDDQSEGANRMMEAMLKMKKLDIAELERAYNGE